MKSFLLALSLLLGCFQVKSQFRINDCYFPNGYFLGVTVHYGYPVLMVLIPGEQMFIFSPREGPEIKRTSVTVHGVFVMDSRECADTARPQIHVNGRWMYGFHPIQNRFSNLPIFVLGTFFAEPNMYNEMLINYQDYFKENTSNCVENQFPELTILFLGIEEYFG